MENKRFQIQGLVDIYTAYNLTLIKRIKGAHSTFITGSFRLTILIDLKKLTSGLEFLPTSEESAACRGLHEASLVSVSVDHQVHKLSFIRLLYLMKALTDNQPNTNGYYFESSLLSLMKVCVHNVSSQSTMSSLVAMLLVVIVLLLTFVLASYLGL